MNTRAMRKAISHRRDYLDQPVLLQLQVALVFVGCLFWVQASIRPEAFSEALYGSFALRFQAEAWAAAMMAPAAMCWVGLRQPIKRWMVAFGATIEAVQFIALAWSAIATGGEPIIGYFCSVIFAPLYAAMAAEAMRDARVE